MPHGRPGCWGGVVVPYVKENRRAGHAGLATRSAVPPDKTQGGGAWGIGRPERGVVVDGRPSCSAAELICWRPALHSTRAAKTRRGLVSPLTMRPGAWPSERKRVAYERALSGACASQVGRRSEATLACERARPLEPTHAEAGGDPNGVSDLRSICEGNPARIKSARSALRPPN